MFFINLFKNITVLLLNYFFKGTCFCGTVINRSQSVESCCNAWRTSRMAPKSYISEESKRSTTGRVFVELIACPSTGSIGILHSRGTEWCMKLPAEEDPKAKDVAFLDEYALERWECVLHYMVGSHQPERLSDDALRILYHAGLMKK